MMEFECGSEVLRALQRMFHLLSWDEDPYENVQVIAPGYPMVMLKMETIKDSWATLYEFLEGVFDNWPTVPEIPSPIEEDAEEAEAEETETDEEANEVDEETDEEAEYESEDDKTDPDMPALISSEDERVNNEILRLLRRLDPQPASNAAPSNANWIEEGELRQNREPIEIRRVVNTPTGPRTYIRFV